VLVEDRYSINHDRVPQLDPELGGTLDYYYISGKFLLQNIKILQDYFLIFLPITKTKRNTH
jgi:hypothetical protein